MTIDSHFIGQNCFSHNIRKVTRALTRYYDAELRPADLKITQFTMLVVINGMGEQSLARIADELGVEPSTLQRNLGILKRHGWVQVTGRRGPAGQSVTLTDEGRVKLEAALPYWQAAQARISGQLGQPASEFLSGLNTLEKALQPSN